MKPVTVNVGGVAFQTTLQTLQAKPESYLAKLTPEDNTIFIDRDPTTFRFVLNYLRGSPVLPESAAMLEELWVEADFFCLHELRDRVSALSKHGPHGASAALSEIVKILRFAR